MITVKKVLTLKDLEKVKLVTPENAGGYWKGTQHAEFARTFLDALNGQDWCKHRHNLSEFNYATSKDEADLLLWSDVRVRDLAPKELVPCVAVMTSNARRFSTTYYVGARDAGNRGYVFRKFTSLGRHVEGNSLIEELRHGLFRWHEFAQDEIKDGYDYMLDYRVSPHDADHLMVQACRDKGRKMAFPWSKLGYLDRAYQDACNGNVQKGTKWRLYRAYSHVVKSCPPLRQADMLWQFGNKLCPLAEKEVTA